MQKSKKLIGILIGLIICLFVAVVPAKAVSVVQIQDLPDYINYTDFKLSCTTNGNTAQFYSKKDGGSYTAFGSPINISTATPCLIQVTGLQFGSEGKFWFQVVVDGTPSNETSVTLDTTAPNKVSDFGKDRTNSGTTYKIHWKNPSDTDYTRVFIYRGEEAGFNADDSHKVSEASGNPEDSMSWEDNGLDSNKDYFYVIRALDRANNASDLAGDAGPDTYVEVLGASASPAAKKTTTVVLPKEQGTGSVLGTEETPAGSASPEISAESINTNPGVFKWILTHKKISGGVLLVLLVAAYGVYRFNRRNK